MPITIDELLRRVPPEIEGKVKRVRDQTRAAIQEALRVECRLQLRMVTDDDPTGGHVQVPIEIAPGYPHSMGDITFDGDVDLLLLLIRFREDLERTKASLPVLGQLQEALGKNEKWTPLVTLTNGEIGNVHGWVKRLLEILGKDDPVEKLLAIRDDWLGVYESWDDLNTDDDRRPNRARIQLYWGVIGITSQWMPCDVEDLTIVILAHELAHAYTQLGADIGGRRWLVHAFHQSQSALKEGLAQYYTERVLTRLSARYGGALEVYRRMLKRQPPAYRTHIPWTTGFSPEAIRRAMIEIRRWREKTVPDFEQRLDAAQKGLEPVTTMPPPPTPEHNSNDFSVN
jgi:hypothetical protein